MGFATNPSLRTARMHLYAIVSKLRNLDLPGDGLRGLITPASPDSLRLVHK